MLRLAMANHQKQHIIYSVLVQAEASSPHVNSSIANVLRTGELFGQVLLNVLHLPVGNAHLLERGARGILHEQVGRGPLRVGDLETFEPTRTLLDELAQRWVCNRDEVKASRRSGGV